MAVEAVTVKVYAVPFVKPETVTGEDAPVPVIDPGDEVTVYEVIGNLEKLGAVKVTDAFALPPVAAPMVGVVGSPFVPALCEPRIGIQLFYLTLVLLIVDLAHI